MIVHARSAACHMGWLHSVVVCQFLRVVHKYDDHTCDHMRWAGPWPPSSFEFLLLVVLCACLFVCLLIPLVPLLSTLLLSRPHLHKASFSLDS